MNGTVHLIHIRRFRVKTPRTILRLIPGTAAWYIIIRKIDIFQHIYTRLLYPFTLLLARSAMRPPPGQSIPARRAYFHRHVPGDIFRQVPGPDEAAPRVVDRSGYAG